jgi:hypothetical protein
MRQKSILLAFVEAVNKAIEVYVYQQVTTYKNSFLAQIN